MTRGPSDGRGKDQPAQDEASERIARETTVQRWLASIRRFDGEAFVNDFLSEWGRMTTAVFLVERVGPFVQTVGEEWARGDLSVAQEHFASEHLRYELSNLWKPLSHWNSHGKTLVLATLPTERHDLGLHMIACIAAECGYRLVFLGANTPLAEIAEAAQRTRASRILISVSAHGDPHRNGAHLVALRESVPRDVRLIVGGSGASTAHAGEGIAVIQDLASAQRLLASPEGRRDA